MTTFSTLLEQNALLALEKQEKLSHLLGDHHWDLDLDTGMIRFNDLQFPFQVLGTESDNTLTWLWAWANEQTEIPDELLRSARELRAWGEGEGIDEFTLPAVDLNRADGHALSMISTAVSGASCYYRAPYEGGAVFLLVSGEAIGRQPPFDLLNLTKRFMDLISLYDLNHHHALVSYFKGRELPFTDSGTQVTADLSTGDSLSADFDASGRLLSLNGKPLQIDATAQVLRSAMSDRRCERSV